MISGRGSLTLIRVGCRMGSGMRLNLRRLVLVLLRVSRLLGCCCLGVGGREGVERNTACFLCCMANSFLEHKFCADI